MGTDQRPERGVAPERSRDRRGIDVQVEHRARGSHDRPQRPDVGERHVESDVPVVRGQRDDRRAAGCGERTPVGRASDLLDASHRPAAQEREQRRRVQRRPERQRQRERSTGADGADQLGGRDTELGHERAAQPSGLRPEPARETFEAVTRRDRLERPIDQRRPRLCMGGGQAPPTRAESFALRGGGAGEELHVGTPRHPRGTDGTTVDARRGHGPEHPSVEPRVAALGRAVARIEVELGWRDRGPRDHAGRTCPRALT